MSSKETHDKEVGLMRNVAPSVLAREELDRLLAGGVDEGSNLISEEVATCTQLVVQSLLEDEQVDLLGGWGRHEPRWGVAGHRGWRYGLRIGWCRPLRGRCQCGCLRCGMLGSRSGPR